jgi:tRNA(adenine34) deaminase
MLAITQAEESTGDWRLTDCTLYVTKEPCPMCAGAIIHVRLPRVVFGATDQKAGAAGTVMNILQFPSLNHRSDITSGVREDECRGMLQTFFAEQRAKKASN